MIKHIYAYHLIMHIYVHFIMQTGDDLESYDSVRKNNKRALGTVKGHFVW